jgi:hypothetical protein
VGVSISIERNFGILKILLFFPTRLDQYNDGPFDVDRTNIVTINKIGDKTVINRKPKDKSIILVDCSC